MNQEAEKLYKKLSDELELLKDNNSEFIYFSKGQRRILVDKSERKLYKPAIRVKNKYVELTVKSMKDGKKKHYSFGRYILFITDSPLNVDHINRNPLDNRRCNLRIKTQSINMLNRMRFRLKYKYKGVIPKPKSYRIEVHSNCKTYSLYLPKTYSEDECAVIYDCIALKLNGNYHETNLKKENYSLRSIESIYSEFESRININDRTNRKYKTKLKTQQICV